MAWTTWLNWLAAHNDVAGEVTPNVLVMKGTGADNNYYVAECNPATGTIPTTATVSLTTATDFGPTNVATRSASIPGNVAGIADFGSGISTAQTMRVSVATDISAVGSPLFVALSNGTSSLAYGSGADGATVLRQTLSTRHETASTPLSVQISNGTAFNSAVAPLYTSVINSSSAPMFVEQTNGTNPIAFGSGADGVTVPRSTLSTRHETVTTPLAFQLSNGTNFNSVTAPSFSQLSNGTVALSYGSGADGSSVLRATLSIRHEAAATPLSFQQSNGTNFAAFGSGADGATVPRQTLSTRHETAATPLAVNISTGANFNAVGYPLFVQLSNGTASNAYGSGADGTTVPRTTLSTRHETVTTPLAFQLSNGTNFNSVSAPNFVQLSNGTNALATASGADGVTVLRATLSTRHEAVATPLAVQLSNGSAAIAYGTGADGSSVPRSTLSTRHETASTPLAVRSTIDGTNFQDSTAITAAQFTKSTCTAIPLGAVFCLGWDGTTHREKSVDTSGYQNINIKSTMPGRTKANAPVRNDYTSTGVTTSAYVQLVASTTSAANRLQIFDSSGQTMILALGGAGSEVDTIYITPGGIDIDYAIPASTRVSIKALSANASVGEIDINFLT